MSTEKGLKNYATVITVLFVLSLIALAILLFSRGKLKNEYTEANAERDALLVERTNLERDLDSLKNVLQIASAENEDLQGSLSDLQKLVDEKEAAVRQIRAQSVNSSEGLRREINQLRQIRGELEGAIGQLQAENEQLRSENERLTAENEQLTTERGQLTSQVSDLNKFNQTLQDQVAQLTRAGIKAQAFRVDVETRSDKLTAKARRTREINIGFDLVDLPEEFQGTHTLYLVLTDVNGGLLPTGGTLVSANIPTPSGSPLQIQAQQTKEVNLSRAQRLSFVYPVEDRLKSGTYVATVYADFGILGSSSFRLR
ncbi:MAG TPA: hypothetical protein PKC76_14920 [Saprospiraceae bacterium]|nr:hypothetical protein [Saprospiraceae bacterium]HMP25425.1 hypothetical protein [Saprospiraceae bacterium]